MYTCMIDIFIISQNSDTLHLQINVYVFRQGQTRHVLPNCQKNIALHTVFFGIITKINN